VAALEEALDHMGSDEAGSAGDEDFHTQDSSKSAAVGSSLVHDMSKQCGRKTYGLIAICLYCGGGSERGAVKGKEEGVAAATKLRR